MSKIGINRLWGVPVLILCLATPLWGMGTQPGEKTSTAASLGQHQAAWSALIEEGVKAGLERRQMEEAAQRMHIAGIAPSAGRSILSPLFVASRNALPADPLIAKMQEGLAKGAGPDALSAAMHNRLGFMQKAADLMSATGYQTGSQAEKEILIATALAQESGLSGTVLKPVLEQSRKKNSNLTARIIEAGEALHLGGIEPEITQALMLDCLERNLRRSEVIRMVRFATEKSRQGIKGAAIRHELWGTGEGRIRKMTGKDSAVDNALKGSGQGLSPSDAGHNRRDQGRN